MRKPGWISLAALAAALPAAAQFEGVVEMKIAMQKANGTAKAWVSKVGSRSEMEIAAPEMKQAGMGTFKLTTLVRFAEPGKSYVLNDARKTYAVVDASSASDARGKKAREETYVVKKLGPDSVAGFSCQNVLVTERDAAGREQELCVSTGILGSTSWFSSGRGERYASEGMMKAIHDAGVEGYPIRMVMREKGAEAVRMELVKATKQSVPASTFEIPPGYAEESLVGTMMSPEAAKQMEDALSKVPPEQRKMIEEMMKKQQERKK